MTAAIDGWVVVSITEDLSLKISESFEMDGMDWHFLTVIDRSGEVQRRIPVMAWRLQELAETLSEAVR